MAGLSGTSFSQAIDTLYNSFLNGKIDHSESA